MASGSSDRDGTADARRVAMRRALHRIKNELIDLTDEGRMLRSPAAEACGEARNAVFLAWTILATPLACDDEDD